MAFSKWPVSQDLAQSVLSQGDSNNVKVTSWLLANVDRLEPEAILGYLRALL